MKPVKVECVEGQFSGLNVGDTFVWKHEADHPTSYSRKGPWKKTDVKLFEHAESGEPYQIQSVRCAVVRTEGN